MSERWWGVVVGSVVGLVESGFTTWFANWLARGKDERARLRLAHEKQYQQGQRGRRLLAKAITDWCNDDSPYAYDEPFQLRDDVRFEIETALGDAFDDSFAREVVQTIQSTAKTFEAWQDYDRKMADRLKVIAEQAGLPPVQNISEMSP